VGRNSNLMVPQGWSAQDKRFGDGVKENLDVLLGHRGDPLQRAVTFQDLLDSNLVRLGGGSSGFSSVGDIVPVVNGFPDLAVPPAPTNLQASGAFQNIILSWNLSLYKGHSYVEVFRHTSDDIAAATMVAQVSGFTGVYADPVGSGQTFYYWVRAINVNGVAGPFNTGTGTQGQTAPDVNFLLTTLANSITSSQLATSLATPIGNLPADTQAAIDLKKASIPTFSMTGFAVGDIVKESGSGTKLYIATQTVPSNGRALTNTSFWKLYGDYASLKSATDTASSAITAINTITSTSTSAAAVKLAAVDAILFDSSGNEIVSASNLSTMSTSLIKTDGSARASAANMDQLSAQYTNPTTGVANNVTLQQALETSASEVDGLRGQYSVKIDTNGHVAGFGFSSTLVGGTPSSAFIVNAEKFAIVSPSDTSAPTNTPNTNNVPFIVHPGGNLDGVTTPAGVYMKSAFIADASIVNAQIRDAAIDNAKIAGLDAGKIDAGTINTSRLNIDGSTLTSVNGVLQIADLAVTNAKIANATIEEGKIKNLAVSTLKIQDQAVTFPNAITTTSALSIQSSSNNTTFGTIQTLTGTYSGAPVLISGSFAVRAYDDQALMRFRLRRGSTVLFTSSSKAVRQSPDLFIIPFNFLDTSTSSGSRTYTLQAYVQDQFGIYSDRTISTLEVKK